MRTLIRFEVTNFVRSGRWLWPLVVYVLVIIGLTALAVRPAHLAYGLVAPVLLGISAWFGWLVCCSLEAPLWHLTMVAVGGRERVLIGRWVVALLTTVVPVVVGVVGAEIGRQADARQPGIWALGIVSEVLAAVFGASLGVLLGATVTQRHGRSVPQGESTPKAVLVIVLTCPSALLTYAGALGALAFLLATMGVAIAALTTG
jgi:hypothetical protein